MPDSRGGWPSVEATTQPLRQSIVELPNEENMVAIGRFRQVSKVAWRMRRTVHGSIDGHDEWIN